MQQKVQALGIRFLKHLARTRILLHIVDVQPIDGSDPVHNAKAILDELIKFSPNTVKTSSGIGTQ